jgi:hypothetical protein
MALTKRSENNIVYLQVKQFCLWRELKKAQPGCETMEVKNPKTSDIITKYGYRFDSVTGRAVKLVKYDTQNNYSTRYFGFKLHLVDGSEIYVLDMPYQSQILRRFLRVAHNCDWEFPVTITIFKGKKKDKEGEELGVWFQQMGETIKPYYTRENPRGMPEAIYDNDLAQWDFKSQHRWLVEQLKTVTIPAIDAAAARAIVPDSQSDEPEPDNSVIPPHGEITDDDVPF